MIQQHVKVGFRYCVQHYRQGVLIDQFEADNKMPIEGQDYMLSAAFAQGSQITAWYAGIYANNYVVADSDSLADFLAHAGEITTATAGANRPLLAMDPPGGGEWRNTSQLLVLEFTQACVITGGFVASAAPKLSSAGILLSAVRFPLIKQVEIGDEFKIPAGLVVNSQ